MTITDGGHVGINKTDPTSQLWVQATTDDNPGLTLYRQSTGGDIASIIWQTGAGTQAKINYRGAAGASEGLQFYTAGGGSSEMRMILDHSGRLGVGTNDPAYKFDVESGDNEYSAQFTGGIRINDKTGSSRQIATASGIFYTSMSLSSSNNTWFTVAKLQYTSGSFTCVVGDASSRNIMTGHFCLTVPAYGVSVFSKKESSGAWNTGSSDIQIVNDGSYMAIQVKHDSYYNDSNSAGCYLMLVQCY
tara:strand:- start:230 stop:967 length:738 start_codon:yes stop_codon:yes gene_type:complete